MEELTCVVIARDLFADHSLDPGELVKVYTSHDFKAGGYCFGVEFQHGDIHFHVGKGAWEESLPPEVPEVRIRRMFFDGKPVAESDWFPC